MTDTEMMLRNELKDVIRSEKKRLADITMINKMYPWSEELQKKFHEYITEYADLVAQENEVRDLLRTVGK